MTTEQVDGHPLNRADVDERVPGSRILQIRLWQHLGVEFLVFAEVPFLKALAVDFVDMVELQSRFRLEGSEGTDRLGCQRTTVDQEQNPPSRTRLHQPVALIDRGEGLTRAGRHREQHLSLAADDGVLDRVVRLDLVRPQTRVVVGKLLEAVVGRFDIRLNQLAKTTGREEIGDLSRQLQFVPNIVKPDDLSVGREQERNSEPPEVEWAVGNALRVPLGLEQYALWAE